jgi:hypothetical protein
MRILLGIIWSSISEFNDKPVNSVYVAGVLSL